MTPEQLGIVGICFALAGAGLKKLWVFGWTYADRQTELAEVKKDRDFWRDTALKAMGHTDIALGVTKKVTEDA